MNALTPIPAKAEPTGRVSNTARDKDAAAFRSLALQLHRNGHEYRRWAREEAAKGHDTAALTFRQRANRYAADALWYWRRARRTT